MPYCNPGRRKYVTSWMATQTAVKMSQKLSKPFIAYKCTDHWHIVLNKGFNYKK